MAIKKIKNTSYREEAIKKMSFKDFKSTYKDILKSQNLEEVYKEITGKQSFSDNKNDVKLG